MTSEQIVALTSAGESEALEFKTTTGMRRSAAMSLGGGCELTAAKGENSAGTIEAPRRSGPLAS
ncbi:MAG: hypothetical protein OXH83_14550 [Bryobacterales bacterium]|nr:hypothetical protein [Bryobacterales bacterium]